MRRTVCCGGTPQKRQHERNTLAFAGIAIKLETKDSVAKFVKVDPDKYHMHVVVPGHPDVEKVKEVNTGVNARLKITIE